MTDFEPAEILPNGTVRGPRCCENPMEDAGSCYDGCCDRYECKTCGNYIKIEWPN